MKARLLLAAVCAASLLSAWAEEPVESFDVLAPIHTYPHWNDPDLWAKHLRATKPASSLLLGRSDFALSGPLVESLRPARRVAPERNLGEKLLSLPIISLFVPQPMPKPPGGGARYFAWGEQDLPWSTVADRDVHGPQCVLVSVSR